MIESQFLRNSVVVLEERENYMCWPYRITVSRGQREYGWERPKADLRRLFRRKGCEVHRADPVRSRSLIFVCVFTNSNPNLRTVSLLMQGRTSAWIPCFGRLECAWMCACRLREALDANLRKDHQRLLGSLGYVVQANQPGPSMPASWRSGEVVPHVVHPSRKVSDGEGENTRVTPIATPLRSIVTRAGRRHYMSRPLIRQR